MQFGMASNVVSNDFDADAAFSRSSDQRLKKNITNQSLGLDFINDLRTVKYNRIGDTSTNKTKIGFIAQDWESTPFSEVTDEDDGFVIEDDGTVSVSSSDKAKLDIAVSQIKAITEDPKVGSVFDGKVTKTLDFGAFVEFAPGREGLVHISHLDWKRVEKVRDVVSVGDKVKVKLFEIDKRGRLNFSIKLLKDKPK